MVGLNMAQAADHFWHVILFEYEGGAGQFRIYNAVDPYHALLKLLAYVVGEAAKEREEYDGCVYLGDNGFQLISSKLLSKVDMINAHVDDVIRIE